MSEPLPLEIATDAPLPPEAITAAARLLLAIVRRERAEREQPKQREDAA